MEKKVFTAALALQGHERFRKRAELNSSQCEDSSLCRAKATDARQLQDLTLCVRISCSSTALCSTFGGSSSKNREPFSAKKVGYTAGFFRERFPIE